ncbi:MAG TPA: hypothetical protein PKY59_26235 [Pyrinomonadaceae bacterium]|nr:hypothetical protein [Pyrinomonadaceae bacterium]
MFGIGKLLGSVAGGLLDKIGLGKIAPFVQMGLNALTGNWLGVAKDVFNLVSSFKGNPLDQAAGKPPLGGFDQPANLFAPERSPLNGNRLSQLFKGLSSLFQGFKALNNGNGLGGFGKIFNAFKTLGELFNNNQLLTNRVSISQYTNIQA